MTEWYQTFWGIILLGVIGSVLGAIFLKCIKVIIDKIGFKVLFNISAELLIPHAENKYLVKMYEQNNCEYLIPITYNMTASKFKRVQITLIGMFSVFLVVWINFLTERSLPLYLPIAYSFAVLVKLYEFIRWHLALSGCFTKNMKEIYKEMEVLKKKDKLEFINSVVD